MNMEGKVLLAAPRAEVWRALNDPEVLARCIPGCQSLERTGENGFAATARVKLGAIGANFRGSVTLEDIVEETSYRIVGAGDGGIAGFAKGAAVVNLQDAEDGGTILDYSVDAAIGGKLAQLGARLLNSVAKKMADQFFGSFAATLEGASGQEQPHSG